MEALFCFKMGRYLLYPMKEHRALRTPFHVNQLLQTGRSRGHDYQRQDTRKGHINTIRYQLKLAIKLAHNILGSTRFVQAGCQHFWQKCTSAFVWTSSVISYSRLMIKAECIELHHPGDKTWIRQYDPESKHQSM